MSFVINVSGIKVQVQKKEIKNLHLGVYPPDGIVRVSAPLRTTDESIRLAIVSKLTWIKKQQQDFINQPRQSERKYVSGECHYFLGKKYRLQLIERNGRHEIHLLKSGRIKMLVRPETSISNKAKLLNDWYRVEINKLLPELLEKWQPIIGKQIGSIGIRKMKTKWGSCNNSSGHILLNLELAKKPVQCFEYILVHEMTHLLERHHNERFKELMDEFMPKWQSRRDLLNKAPLVHDDWVY